MPWIDPIPEHEKYLYENWAKQLPFDPEAKQPNWEPSATFKEFLETNFRRTLSSTQIFGILEETFVERAICLLGNAAKSPSVLRRSKILYAINATKISTGEALISIKLTAYTKRPGNCCQKQSLESWWTGVHTTKNDSLEFRWFLAWCAESRLLIRWQSCRVLSSWAIWDSRYNFLSFCWELFHLNNKLAWYFPITLLYSFLLYLKWR